MKIKTSRDVRRVCDGGLLRGLQPSWGPIIGEAAGGGKGCRFERLVLVCWGVMPSGMLRHPLLTRC
jgi:hypothetical protein